MIEKVRVHEIAKELGIASKDVLEKAKKMGLEVKSAQSVVTMEQAESIANYIMNGDDSAQTQKPQIVKTSKKVDSDTPKEQEKEIKKIEKEETSSEQSVKKEDVVDKDEIAEISKKEQKKTTSKETPQKVAEKKRLQKVH